MDDYDYVIVGAGSAGSWHAYRRTLSGASRDGVALHDLHIVDGRLRSADPTPQEIPNAR